MGKVIGPERPDWCPHPSCEFIRLTGGGIMCCGRLPEPEPHGGDFNTNRICLEGAGDNGGVFDLQINRTDVWWFRHLFDYVEIDLLKQANLNQATPPDKDEE